MIEQTFCCVLDIELLPEEAFRIAADKSTTLFSASETKASSRAERVSSFKTVDEKCLSKPIISCLRCVSNSISKTLLYNFTIRWIWSHCREWGNSALILWLNTNSQNFTCIDKQNKTIEVYAKFIYHFSWNR